jgi:hypothetical protein
MHRMRDQWRNAMSNRKHLTASDRRLESMCGFG